MAYVWTIKAGEAQKDVVYNGSGGLSDVGSDEAGICLSSTVGTNQTQLLGLIDQCIEALREAGFPLPATGLCRADAVDGDSRGNITVTLTGATTTIVAAQISIAYGTAFPRAGAGGATLLFDEALSEIKKAIVEHYASL